MAKDKCSLTQIHEQICEQNLREIYLYVESLISTCDKSEQKQVFKFLFGVIFIVRHGQKHRIATLQ